VKNVKKRFSPLSEQQRDQKIQSRAIVGFLMMLAIFVSLISFLAPSAVVASPIISGELSPGGVQ